MENVLADDSTLELQIDASSRESLENGSWWARFIGIVFIVVIVLVLCLLAFYLQPIMSQLEYRFGFSGVTGVLWGIVAISIIIIGIVLALLMNFAVKTNKAVKELDQAMLEKGINSLKVYMIVMGIFAVISLVITLFGLVFANSLSRTY